ncbi:MAG: sulfotransferase domain-containing protein [Nanoarchaeota archaeon]
MGTKEPNFFIPGFSKAATSFMYELLRRHHQIYLPEIKETNFFKDETEFKKGYKWYLKKYYSKIKDEKIIGDATPSYIHSEKALQRIKTNIKSPKIIIILRNPITRAYSLYNMKYYNGTENKPTFLEAIESSQIYIKKGKYDIYLNNVYKYFKKKDILILVYEKDILKNFEQTLIKISNFLNIEKFNYKFDKQINRRKIARVEFIRKILRIDGKLDLILKKIIISRYLYLRTMNLLRMINSKKSNKQLSKKEISKLNKKYYSKHIKNTEKIIKRKLDIWR